MSTRAASLPMRRRREGAVALWALVLALSGCHAIKVQLGMNAGASTSSSTPTSSTSSSSGDASSAQSASGGKKVHLGGGGGDKGQPGLLETLGRDLHDSHESSNFDASPYGVTPPKFKWNSRIAGSPDRGSKHHL